MNATPASDDSVKNNEVEMKMLNAVTEWPVIERPKYASYDVDVMTADGPFRAGLWLHGVKNKNDGTVQSFDMYICGPLQVMATTACDGLGFGRQIRFRNTQGDICEWVMPMSMLSGSGDEVRREFLQRGLAISTRKAEREALNEYLMNAMPSKFLQLASATGWFNESLFILPRNKIGSGDVLFKGENTLDADYASSGTLEQWQSLIGGKCHGNPLLLLAIGAALAGPLLNRLGMLGGGFHFLGDSSCGKSTLLAVAASVWGHADIFKRTWRATDNGLEGLASQRNDTLLVLDELGEADPYTVGKTVYALANGTGKARASRDGSAKETRHWRVMVLSSGERCLADVMQEAGKKTNVGQELRLVSVGATRTYGCWDDLHGEVGGAEFSNALQKASKETYGHLGPKFVASIIGNSKVNINELYQEELQKLQAHNGKSARVAERFAAIALALELAAEWELLPIVAGTGSLIAAQLFSEWSGGNSGVTEDEIIAAEVIKFIELEGGSAFADISRERYQKGAGWKKKGCDGVTTWMFTSAGLEGAVKGYGLNRILKALEAIGMLSEKDAGRRNKSTKTTEGYLRLYYVRLPTQ